MATQATHRPLTPRERQIAESAAQNTTATIEDVAGWFKVPTSLIAPIFADARS